MDISDKIQLAGILLATITSIISIIISVVTLRSNSRMLKDSTRPYVSAYFDALQCGSTPRGYIIIKNFGQSAATIISIRCNDALNDSGTFGVTTAEHLKRFENACIAPGQKFQFPVDVADYKDKIAILDICYKHDIDIYQEHISLRIDSYASLLKVRSTSKDTLKIISSTLQEIAERMD